MSNRSVYIDAQALARLATGLFRACGLSDGDALTVARSLVAADLRGVGTHGVARIPAYVERFRQRLVNPQPRIRVEQRLPWAAVVDGDNGMGAMVAAPPPSVTATTSGPPPTTR